MPLFDYECSDCGHTTAFLEKAGTKKKHACEKCSSTRTSKLFSTFASRTASPSLAMDCLPGGT